MDKRYERLAKKQFHQLLRSDGIIINLQYDIAPVDATNKLWTTGQVQYKNNIKALYQVVSNLNIAQFQYANVKIGKYIFYVDYDLVSLKDTKNIKIFWRSDTFNIDKAIPDGALSDGFLNWMLVQA